MPRRREGLPRRRGPPRCGQPCLSEPDNMEGGHSSPPRCGQLSLGEPLRLREGGLRLGVPATA